MDLYNNGGFNDNHMFYVLVDKGEVNRIERTSNYSIK